MSAFTAPEFQENVRVHLNWEQISRSDMKVTILSHFSKTQGSGYTGTKDQANNSKANAEMTDANQHFQVDKFFLIQIKLQ